MNILDMIEELSYGFEKQSGKLVEELTMNKFTYNRILMSTRAVNILDVDISMNISTIYGLSIVIDNDCPDYIIYVK